MEYIKAYEEHPIFCDEKNIILEILVNPSVDLYRELFSSRTRKHRYWLVGVECATIGLFDDLIQLISSENAFISILFALEIIKKQQEKDLFISALSILAGLIEKSMTTETPSILKDELPLLKDRVTDCNDADTFFLWERIVKWYRY